MHSDIQTDATQLDQPALETEVEPTLTVEDVRQANLDISARALQRNPDGSYSYRRTHDGRLDIDFVERENTPATYSVLSPAMYRKAVETNPALLRTKVSDIPVFMPSAERRKSVYDSLDFLEQVNPTLAERIRGSSDLVFLAADVAAAFSDSLEGGQQAFAYSDFIEKLVEANGTIYTSQQLGDDFFAGQEVVVDLLDRLDDFLGERERGWAATAFAVTPLEKREQMAALAWRYLDENPDIAGKEDKRLDFIWWLHQQAQGFRRQAKTPTPKVFEVLDAPYRRIVEPILKAPFRGIASPDEWKWRQFLTPGQNLLVSVGRDPSDWGWNIQSGIIDGFNLIVFDPINIVAGAAVGAKVARVAPRVGKAVEMGRLAYASRVALPFVGKRAAPALSLGERNIWSRVTYALFSKTAEEIATSPKAARVAEEIVKLNRTGQGIEALVTEFPELRSLLKSEEGLSAVKAIADATEPEQVQELIATLLVGVAPTEYKTTVAAAKETVANVRRRTRQVMKKLGREGRLGIDDVADEDDIFSGIWMMQDQGDGLVTWKRVSRDELTEEQIERVRLAQKTWKEADLISGPQRKVLEDELTKMLAKTDTPARVIVSGTDGIEVKVLKKPMPGARTVTVDVTAKTEEEASKLMEKGLTPAGTNEKGDMVFRTRVAVDEPKQKYLPFGQQVRKERIPEPPTKKPTVPIDPETGRLTKEALKQLAMTFDIDPRKIRSYRVVKAGEDEPWFVDRLLTPSQAAELLDLTPDELRLLTQKAVYTPEDVIEISRTKNEQVGLPGDLYTGPQASLGTNEWADYIPGKRRKEVRTDALGGVEDRRGRNFFIMPGMLWATEDPDLALGAAGAGENLSQGLSTVARRVHWNDKKPPRILDLNKPSAEVNEEIKKIVVGEWKKRKDGTRRWKPGLIERPYETIRSQIVLPENFGKVLDPDADPLEKIKGLYGLEIEFEELGVPGSISDNPIARFIRWILSETAKANEWDINLLSTPPAVEEVANITSRHWTFQAMRRATDRYNQAVEAIVERAKFEGWPEGQLQEAILREKIELDSQLETLRGQARQAIKDAIRRSVESETPIANEEFVFPEFDEFRKADIYLALEDDGILETLSGVPGIARAPRGDTTLSLNDVIELIAEQEGTVPTGINRALKYDTLRRLIDLMDNDEIPAVVAIEMLVGAMEEGGWVGWEISAEMQKLRYRLSKRFDVVKVGGEPEFDVTDLRKVINNLVEDPKEKTRLFKLYSDWWRRKGDVVRRKNLLEKDLAPTDWVAKIFAEEVAGGEFRPPERLSEADALFKDIVDTDAYRQVKQSMIDAGNKFDASKPITIGISNRQGYSIVDGVKRLIAASELGIRNVPVRFVRTIGSPEVGSRFEYIESVMTDWLAFTRTFDVGELKPWGITKEEALEVFKVFERRGVIELDPFTWPYYRVNEEKLGTTFVPGVPVVERGVNPAPEGADVVPGAVRGVDILQGAPWSEAESPPMPDELVELWERATGVKRSPARWGFLNPTRKGLSNKLQVQTVGGSSRYVRLAMPANDAAREILSKIGADVALRFPYEQYEELLRQGQLLEGVGLPLRVRDDLLDDELARLGGEWVSNPEAILPPDEAAGLRQFAKKARQAVEDVVEEPTKDETLKAAQEASGLIAPSAEEQYIAAAEQSVEAVQRTSPAPTPAAAEAQPVPEPPVPKEIPGQERLPFEAPNEEMSVLSTDARELLAQWGQEKGYHALRVGENEWILTERGRKGLTPVVWGKVNDPELVQARTGVVEAATEEVKAVASDNTVLLIKQLPTRRSRFASHVRKWWRHRGGDADGFVANFKRQMVARLSDPDFPSEIRLDNVERGARDLRTVLRQLGVPEDKVMRYLDEFYRALPVDRHDLVNDIIARAADDVDHPIIKYHLREWIRSNQATVPYGLVDGEPVGLAAARTDDLPPTPKPITISQLSSAVPMFDADFYRMLRRYQSAKAMSSTELGRRLVRGLTSGTIDRRANIVGVIRSKLSAQGVKVDDMTDDELYAIAYSLITNNDDMSGLGKLAQFNSSIKAMWMGTMKFFTRNQLALRPWSWLTRVALLDEQLRGAIFDLPSIYRNPFSWFADTLAAHHIKKLDRAVVKGAEQVATAVAPLRKVKTMEEALPIARELVAGIDDLLPEGASVATLRDTVERVLTDAVMRGDRFNPGQGVGRRIRKAMRTHEKAAKARQRFGLDPDMTWDEVMEITHKGLASLVADEMASSYDVIAVGNPATMSALDRRIASQAWGKTVHRLWSDRWVREFALPRLAAKAAGKSPDVDGAHLVLDPGWAKMRSIIARQAEHAGQAFDDDAALATWYLDNILEPWVDEVFRPLSSADGGWDNLINMQRGKVELSWGKRTSTIRFGAERDLLEDLSRLWEKFAPNPELNQTLPSAVVGVRSPYMLEKGNPFSRMYNRVTSAVIEFAGEKMTQALNRRPAYLRLFKRELDYLLSRGFDEKMARQLAHQQAAEMVNYVYFNMADTTPFLRAMNKVFPFFGALWEVNQTWAYKVPFASAAGSYGMGAATIAHRADRLLKSMLQGGLIEFYDDGRLEGSALPDPSRYEEGTSFFLTSDGFEGKWYKLEKGEWRVDPERKVAARQYRLRMSKDLDSGNEFFEAASRLAWTWPGTAAQVTKLLSAVSGQDADVFADADFVASVGNPFDPRSQGLLSATSLSLGLNPLAGLVVSRYVRPLPWWAGASKDVVTDEQTVGELAESLGRGVAEIAYYNKEVIVDALGDEAWNTMMRGGDLAEAIELPAGLQIRVPRSTTMSEVMDGLFFPYGNSNTWQQSAAAFFPSWMNFMLRGFGMAANYYDEGTIAGPFLELITPPTTKAAMAGDILLASQFVEARDRSFSKAVAAANELNAFVDEIRRKLQNPDLTQDEIVDLLEPGSEDAKRYGELRAEVARLNDIAFRESVDIAAQISVQRAIAGAFGPSNPRMVLKEMERRAMYYDSRDAVRDAAIAGSELVGVRLEGADSVKDIEAFYDLMKAWWLDDTGDEAKLVLRRQLPELEPFILGKSYWVSGGKPAEAQEIEDYFEQIESGLRDIYDWPVFSQLMARQGLAISEEAEIRAVYGEDLITAVPNILYNWRDWKDFQLKYDAEYSALDWFDDAIGRGAFKEFRERGDDNFPTLLSEIRSLTRDLIDDADTLLSITPEFEENPEQQRELTVRLKRFVDAMEKAYGATYTGGANFRNPREEAIFRYFSEVVAPFFRDKTVILEEIAQTSDSEVRSALFDRLRQLNNDEFFRRREMKIGDAWVQVPNAVQFLMGASEQDLTEYKTQRALVQNPVWMDAATTRRLVQMEPALADYLPTTPADFAIYDDYSRARIEAQEKLERGEISVYEYNNKIAPYLKQQLRDRLREQGREGEAMWLDMTPAQRFATAGLLPEFLQPYLARFNAIADYAASLEKNLESTSPEVTQYIVAEFQRFVNTAPEDVVQQTRELALQLYGTTSLDIFFTKFFVGRNIGDI